MQRVQVANFPLCALFCRSGPSSGCRQTPASRSDGSLSMSGDLHLPAFLSGEGNGSASRIGVVLEHSRLLLGSSNCMSGCTPELRVHTLCHAFLVKKLSELVPNWERQTPTCCVRRRLGQQSRCGSLWVLGACLCLQHPLFVVPADGGGLAYEFVRSNEGRRQTRRASRPVPSRRREPGSGVGATPLPT